MTSLVAQAPINTERYPVENFLPAETFEQITEVRVHHPQWIEQEARARKKRRRLTRDRKSVV